MEMVLEPLLRERVSYVSAYYSFTCAVVCILRCKLLLLLLQGFGVAEGRHKEHLKNMANAAGQSCRDYTPPGGETLDQVSQIRVRITSLRNYKPATERHGERV